jgi:hypothetical protein
MHPDRSSTLERPIARALPFDLAKPLLLTLLFVTAGALGIMLSRGTYFLEGAIASVSSESDFATGESLRVEAKARGGQWFSFHVKGTCDRREIVVGSLTRCASTRFPLGASIRVTTTSAYGQLCADDKKYDRRLCLGRRGASGVTRLPGLESISAIDVNGQPIAYISYWSSYLVMQYLALIAIALFLLWHDWRLGDVSGLGWCVVCGLFVTYAYPMGVLMFRATA